MAGEMPERSLEENGFTRIRRSFNLWVSCLTRGVQ